MPTDTDRVVYQDRAAHAMPSGVKPKRAAPLMLRLLRLGFRVGGAVSPRLAGRAAYRLWFTPTRFRTPATERQALASAAITYQGIRDQSIATYRWGQSGPVVLLVHGWSGRGTQLGAFVEPLISEGFRVLSFDYPAHGKSSGRQTNLFEIVDVMLALSTRYGPFRAVITHSFGGPCTAVALRRGLETATVVSIAPPARTGMLVDSFAHALSIPQRAKQDFVRRFQHAYGADIFETTSMERNVRELDKPALVIHDEDDADIPWQEGQAVAAAWQNAGFIKTCSLGHRRILRDPFTIDTVVKFIRSA